jgi:glutathione S-transferase
VPVPFFGADNLPFRYIGKLPVLSDDGCEFLGSWDIATYLDAEYSDRPALMSGPEALTLARFVSSWSDHVLFPNLLRVVLPEFVERLHIKDRESFRQSREQWIGATVEQIRENRTAYLSDLCRSLAPLRSALAVQGFLGGTSPSYADIVAGTMIVWARFVSQRPVLADDDPLHAWLARIEDRFQDLPLHPPRTA